MGNQGVQQWGDTGQVDPRQWNYRPGLETVVGGGVGAASSPAFQNAVREFFLARQQKLLSKVRGNDIEKDWGEYWNNYHMAPNINTSLDEVGPYTAVSNKGVGSSSTLERYFVANEVVISSGQEIALPKNILNNKDLIKAASYSPNKEISEAARAIISHVDNPRRGATAFPRITGNIIQKNQAAQRMIEEILSHPKKETVIYYHNRFKTGMLEIRTPIGGLRYNQNGKFIGVIEP